MPAIAGRKSTFEVSADGNTFVHVDGLVDISFSYNVSEIECTKHSTGLSDAGRREFLPNLEDRTFDISCRWLDGDPGQDIILDAATTKTLFYYRFKMDPLTEIPFIGRAFATSISPTGPLDDTAGVDFSLRCTTLGITPALDLQFADDLSLTDQVTGNNLVTFTRATSATYVGADGLIKTAASGEPRFDHDPITGESLGLLIEEQRTNLLTYSEEDWSIATATIQQNISVSPSGTLTADRVTSTGDGGVYKSAGNSSGQTVTCSAFVKYVSGVSNLSSFGIEYLGGVVINARVNFDFITGTVTSSTANVENYSVTRYANGWFRVSVTATATATGFTTFISYAPTGAVFDIWGAQVELGAFPTSYIPTTGAQVTRNHDDVLISGANFSSWYNQNEGSFFTEYQRPLDAKGVVYSNPYIVSVSQGTSTTDRILIYTSTSSTTDEESFLVVTGGTTQASILIPQAIGANEPAKISAAYKTNDAAASRDGASSLTDNSVTLYTSMDRMRIGNYINNITTGQAVHNGTIKRIAYYNTRIPNAALQEITIK